MALVQAYMEKSVMYLMQRPDQYKMKKLVLSIQYDFQILKYQYSIKRILNKYQYQYARKNEVSVFSISILSGKKHEKASKQAKQIWKIEVNYFYETRKASFCMSLPAA